MCHRRKVKDWALRSHGCFPVVAPGIDADEVTGWGESTNPSNAPSTNVTFVPWAELQHADVKVQQRTKWGKVKGVHRAIEKVLRTYGGDVSRCRNTLMVGGQGGATRVMIMIMIK